MTNAPYLLPQARKGYRLGNAQIVDSMVNDGLWDIYNNYHMGITGENVAEKYGITREEQDEFARELASQGDLPRSKSAASSRKSFRSSFRPRKKARLR